MLEIKQEKREIFSTTAPAGNLKEHCFLSALNSVLLQECGQNADAAGSGSFA